MSVLTGSERSFLAQFCKRLGLKHHELRGVRGLFVDAPKDRCRAVVIRAMTPALRAAVKAYLEEK